MTRHENFRKRLEAAYDELERRRPFPQERHAEMIEYLLISIAGSLAIIADALNPGASEVKEERDG